MRRCLRDRALFLLYEGEGTDVQRAHLETCEACAQRYQRLVDDLAVIRRTLREESLPRVLYRAPQPSHLRWAPLVTVLTVTLIFVWGGMWAWKLAPPFPRGQTPNEEIWQFLGDVSSATLPAVTNIEDTPTRISDFVYLRHALGEE